MNTKRMSYLGLLILLLGIAIAWSKYAGISDLDESSENRLDVRGATVVGEGDRTVSVPPRVRPEPLDPVRKLQSKIAGQ